MTTPAHGSPQAPDRPADPGSRTHGLQSGPHGPTARTGGIRPLPGRLKPRSARPKSRPDPGHLRAAYVRAARENPDQAARTVVLARRLGAHPALAAQDPEENAALAQAPDFRDLAARSPVLAALALDPDFLACARDDLAALMDLEAAMARAGREAREPSLGGPRPGQEGPDRPDRSAARDPGAAGADPALAQALAAPRRVLRPAALDRVMRAVARCRLAARDPEALEDFLAALNRRHRAFPDRLALAGAAPDLAPDLGLSPGRAAWLRVLGAAPVLPVEGLLARLPLAGGPAPALALVRTGSPEPGPDPAGEEALAPLFREDGRPPAQPQAPGLAPPLPRPDPDRKEYARLAASARRADARDRAALGLADPDRPAPELLARARDEARQGRDRALWRTLEDRGGLSRPWAERRLDPADRQALQDKGLVAARGGTTPRSLGRSLGLDQDRVLALLLTRPGPREHEQARAAELAARRCQGHPWQVPATAERLDLLEREVDLLADLAARPRPWAAWDLGGAWDLETGWSPGPDRSGGSGQNGQPGASGREPGPGSGDGADQGSRFWPRAARTAREEMRGRAVAGLGLDLPGLEGAVRDLGREAARAARAGDWPLALDRRARQVLALVRLKEERRAVNQARGLMRVARLDLASAKARGPAREQAAAILADHGLLPRGRRACAPEVSLARFRDLERGPGRLALVDLPRAAREDRPPCRFRDLTLAGLENAARAARQAGHLARTTDTTLAPGRARPLDQAARQAAAALQAADLPRGGSGAALLRDLLALSGPGDAGPFGQDPDALPLPLTGPAPACLARTGLDPARADAAGTDGAGTGGSKAHAAQSDAHGSGPEPDGPSPEDLPALFGPLARGLALEDRRTRGLLARLGRILAPARGHGPGWWEALAHFPDPGLRLGRGQMLMIALYAGHAQGRRVLDQVLGLSGPDLEAVLRRLGPAEARMVEAVWDLCADLRTRADRARWRLTGSPLARPQPLDTVLGPVRTPGGWFPVLFDREQAPPFALLAAPDPGPGPARLRLDPAALVQAVLALNRAACLAPAVRDAVRILDRPQTAQALDRAGPGAAALVRALPGLAAGTQASPPDAARRALARLALAGRPRGPWVEDLVRGMRGLTADLDLGDAVQVLARSGRSPDGLGGMGRAAALLGRGLALACARPRETAALLRRRDPELAARVLDPSGPPVSRDGAAALDQALRAWPVAGAWLAGLLAFAGERSPGRAAPDLARRTALAALDGNRIRPAPRGLALALRKARAAARLAPGSGTGQSGFPDQEPDPLDLVAPLLLERLWAAVRLPARSLAADLLAARVPGAAALAASACGGPGMALAGLSRPLPDLDWPDLDWPDPDWPDRTQGGPPGPTPHWTRDREAPAPPDHGPAGATPERPGTRPLQTGKGA